jgi:hypothetical protein
MFSTLADGCPGLVFQQPTPPPILDAAVSPGPRYCSMAKLPSLVTCSHKASAWWVGAYTPARYRRFFNCPRNAYVDLALRSATDWTLVEQLQEAPTTRQQLVQPATQVAGSTPVRARGPWHGARGAADSGGPAPSVAGAGASRLLSFRAQLSCLLRQAFADSETQEHYIRQSAVAWTIARPRELTDVPFTGVYQQGFAATAKGLRIKIARALGRSRLHAPPTPRADLFAAGDEFFLLGAMRGVHFRGLLLATLPIGLITGLFYGFSAAINPALARLPDAGYIETMQAINGVLQNL